MATLNFGYTWWGKKWLDALAMTDYSNRLPRGKSYARSEKVRNVSATPQGVVAKVQGSFPIPYNVSLSLKPFSQKEKNSIVDIIVNNSIYLASLLNRKLPEDLYLEFEQVKIRLFPQNWSEVLAKCSCPDWASCCKHIAAVIYMVANAIDKNPFLVFELHGLNIFAELEARGFVIAENDRQTIKRFTTWLEKKAPAKNRQLNWDEIRNLDFSVTPFLQAQIFSLLDAKPLFYPNDDFKKILEKMYKGVARNIEPLFFDAEDSGLISNDLQNIVDLTIEFSDILDEQVVLKIPATKGNRKKTSQQFLEFGALLGQLHSIPAKKLPEYHDKVVFLCFVKNFALKLLQQGAFIPELISVDENAYRIRWLPALLNQNVATICKRLVAVCPHEIIAINFDEGKIFTPEESVNNLLSLFIQHYIEKYCIHEASLDLHHEIHSLFFCKDILEIKTFANQELPTTIALWLSKFYITHKTYVPVLRIDEGRKDFTASVLVENRKRPLDALIPLAQLFEVAGYQNIAVSVFKDLQLLQVYFPEIAAILNSKGLENACIDAEKIADFLFKQLPILKMLGIPLLLPKGLEELVRPKLSLAVKANSGKALTSYLSLQSMLQFNWEIALGTERVNAVEFKKLLKNSRGVVRIKDQFVYFDEKEMQKMLCNLEKEPQLSGAEKIFAIIAEEYDEAKVNLSDEVKKQMEELRKINKVVLPKNLQAKLRPYQQRGYEWLYKNANFGFGSLIADDMGLGKTVQIISLLLKLEIEGKLNKHPALVVVPTSLLSNWQAEIAKFAPTLIVHIYHGAKRELVLKNQHVFITSYGLLRKDIETFAKYKWPAFIIDEAQNIKNPDTEQTQAIKKIKSDIRIAMTGTPVENRLSEYWSIFDFLNKGYLYGLETFKNKFAVPIEVDRSRERMELFKKVTTPFILRRLKTDKSIIKDLPDKIEIDQYNQLSKEQTALYQSLVDDIMEKIENANGMARRGLIFKLMTGLKQICNHPSHFQKKKVASPDLSGKTSLLLEMLKNIYESNEKVLIFTQYKEMGALLQTIIKEQYGINALLFHGGLTRNARDEIVHSFQNDQRTNTLILSLKAGGTGLNLTAASNVIHFDLWWNPAVEAQATDRAYRIGQKSNVMVYRMITKNTFEEKIDAMIKSKKELANLTVSVGEKWIGEFSNQELASVFSLSE